MALKRYNDFVNENNSLSQEEQEAYAYLDANFVEGRDYILADMIGDDEESNNYHTEIFNAMVDKLREDVLKPGYDETVANDWVEGYLATK